MRLYVVSFLAVIVPVAIPAAPAQDKSVSFN